MSAKKNFPPYEEAKKRVIDAGIKCDEEYKSKYKELGLPSVPQYTYKEEWIGWHSFLGKEKIELPSYEEAKKRVIDAGIKNRKEYYAKYKEHGLPSNPNCTYKDKGWIDWPSFLGKEKKPFPSSYEDTKRIAIENGIKSQAEYWAKSKELGLPSRPQCTYKEEWIGWFAFLEKEAITYPTYEKAKKIVMENGIKRVKEYMAKSKELRLPSAPNIFYKDKGWIDWPSFFEKETFPTYEKAKSVVMEAGIKSYKAYGAKYKEFGLPSAPNIFYKDKGWTDWADFLGKAHRTTPLERKTKVLTKLALNPILLGDKAPLQIIYMLASNWDKDLADEIELLLTSTSFEERLDWVKEQLKTLKVDTSTTPDATSEKLDGEIPAMESMLEIFEDSMDDLPDEVSTNIKAILENYYHNVINKELIEEFDD